MRKIVVFPLIAGLIFLLSNGAFGQDSDKDTLAEPTSELPVKDSLSTSGGDQFNVLKNLKLSGWGAFEFGQIMHGMYFSSQLDHKWQECFDSRLTATAQVNDRLLINISTAISYQYSTLQITTNGPSMLPGINVCLDRADLAYTPIPGNFPLMIQVGYFPFKYNPEARNLGEYLFRSGCYPTFVTNNFDFPMNRLLGLNIENTLFKDNSIISFHQNLLLTSETELYPYEDISLSYLPSVSVWNNVFTLGGGICGQRMFSVDNENTTPHDSKTISEVTNIKDTVDQVGTPITIGDTTFFSFAGVKAMGHMTFDPKPLFPSRIFGPEDLKLYGELAVLGLKNYPYYKDSTIRYDILSERMPIMVGFNFPTFKILDVLSLEFEYFKNRYYNSYFYETYGTQTGRLPLPYLQAVGDRTGTDSLSYAHNVKWSVYAKKSLGRNVAIVAQVAKDHRHAFINLSDPRYGDYGDNLTTAKDWYYMVKVAYGF
jgi:hypothetical protein